MLKTRCQEIYKYVKNDVSIWLNIRIGLFQKYHNTLYLPSKNLHKHCFQFYLGLTMVPRENKNNTFGRQIKSIMVFLKVAYR